jgi:DNA-binding NtrC family response regulator
LGVVPISSKAGACVAKAGARSSILVLDDDQGFRRFLVQALSGAGYSVVDSGDANEVLAILDGAIPFDLLITDVKMPRLQPHGIAVGNMEMIKRREMKIIYVTGDPTQVPRDFIDAAKTPLLGKPIRLDVFIATVGLVSARRRCLLRPRRRPSARERGRGRPALEGAADTRAGGQLSGISVAALVTIARTFS